MDEDLIDFETPINHQQVLKSTSLNFTLSAKKKVTSSQNSNEINLAKSFNMNRILNFFIDFKTVLILIVLNVVFFHLDKLIFNMFLLLIFLAGLCYFIINNEESEKNFTEYLKTRRVKYFNSSGLIKSEGSFDLLNETDADLVSSCNSLTKQFFDQRSIKPSITGSYLIDDELHKTIELIIRDYIDSWYKTNISTREDFSRTVRITIYKSIRYITSCLKLIDWEQFIMNTMSHNLVIHMRILKKAREKRGGCNAALSKAAAVSLSSKDSASKSPTSSKTSINILSDPAFLSSAQSIATTHENNLLDLFFDFEAEIEKCVCRDEISMSLKEHEQELYQELSEIICYSLLSTPTFNCLPFRCLIREIFANFLIRFSIDRLTDPDYINQTLLYLCQDQPALTENFLLTLSHSDNLDELCEVRLKIDEEIQRTRSYDKGGQNDNEIKLRLSSLYYVKRRIDSSISNMLNLNQKSPQSQTSNNLSAGNVIINQQMPSLVNQNLNNSEIESRLNNFNANLANLDFGVILSNEAVQHCFIEYMAKLNVQNLISFYLNADMFRQFAKKELNKCIEETRASDLSEKSRRINEVRMAIQDFAKGLIHSYLLSANNFTANKNDEDDEPVNIINRGFYKSELVRTIENSETSEFLNEYLLDELQAKIFDLMQQKYYPTFKNYSEFHKLLGKNDLLSKLSLESLSKNNLVDDEINFTSNNNNEDEESLNLGDETRSSLDIVSESSFEMYENSNIQEAPNFILSAVISSSGRCNDLKSTYAIYIIDVTKVYLNTGKNEYWQTYRRFNDFYDFHLTIKKRFPNLSKFNLPGKSFRNSLSEEFLEKRRIELNRYLQTLCNPDVLTNNPQLLELLVQFLENKRWDNSQTNLKRRIDSIFTPMISSVQNIQTSIKNAPENVFGMVKGISDNLIPVVDTFSKINNNNPAINNASNNNNNNLTPSLSHNKSANNLTLLNNSSSLNNTKIQIDKKDLSSIDKTILNNDDMQSNNLPVKVVLALIDEIFDLKENNQWIRQSLMAIVKTFMKNFKGDSMKKKIKEQIADYLKEEHIARYLKNFRKRMWPKGYLADTPAERSKSVKEITKILAKTKLLANISDELRHILGNDVTRRGIFDLFDLFQHKQINKRLLLIIVENFLINFFQTPSSNSTLNSPSAPSTYFHFSFSSYTQIQQFTAQITPNPVSQSIRIHLARSSRVKAEWRKTSPKQKQISKKEDNNQLPFSTSTSSINSTTNSPNILNSNNKKIASTNLINTTPVSATNNTSPTMPRSKSLHHEIQC